MSIDDRAENNLNLALENLSMVLRDIHKIPRPLEVKRILIKGQAYALELGFRLGFE